MKGTAATAVGAMAATVVFVLTGTAAATGARPERVSFGELLAYGVQDTVHKERSGTPLPFLQATWDVSSAVLSVPSS
ncbi:hypothetical protein [Streptomyces sp. NPDC001480]|uniref:hypothetical protein n=1 Tax=Streptomyces sp. NPDC001480 TaxID=3364577 RepID=UPI0036C4EA58